MNNLRFITIVIALLQCAESLQASGRAAKLAVPLAKVSIAGTTALLTPKVMVSAEGSQAPSESYPSILTSQKTPANYVRRYEQSNEFKSKHADSTSAHLKKINSTNNEHSNQQKASMQEKAATTGMHEINKINNSKQPTMTAQEIITPTIAPKEITATMQLQDVVNMQTNNSAKAFDITNNFIYQKPTGGRFEFKVKPNLQAKRAQAAKQDQLLLTYDPTYTPITKEPVLAFHEKNEPIQLEQKNNAITTDQNVVIDSKSRKASKKILTATEKDALKNSAQAQEKRQARQEKSNNAKDVSAYDLALQNEQSLDVLYKPTPKLPQIDVAEIIKQQYIHDVTNKSSQVIDNWQQYRDEFMSESTHQKMLENDILDLISTKDHNKLRTFNNSELDLEVINKLIKKNKQDLNIIRGLQPIRKIIQDHVTETSFIPMKANSLITRYYTPSMRNEIFSFINEKPIYNSSREIINMPKIESILKISLSTPTRESLKALQTSLKATQSTIDAIKRNSSYFNDKPLVAQLKLFETSLTTTLQDPRFTQFRSWGSYATSALSAGQSYAKSALSSAGTSAFNATIGQIPLGTAYNIGQSAIKIAAPHTDTLLSVSGVKDMTLLESAKKTGIIKPTKQQLITAWPEGPKKPKTNSLDQQLNYDIKPQDAKAMSLRTNANNAIAEYYSPATENYILSTMKIKPVINSANQTVMNIPSVQEILVTAITHPNQQTFNTLEVIHEATKVAINATRRETSDPNKKSLLKELQSYEKDINIMLKSPQFMKYQSYTTQAATYVSQFIPSAETVLNTTGLGAVTVGTAINAANAATPYVQMAIDTAGLKPALDTAHYLTQAAVNYSGLPTMTIEQTMNMLK